MGNIRVGILSLVQGTLNRSMNVMSLENVNKQTKNDYATFWQNDSVIHF